MNGSAASGGRRPDQTHTRFAAGLMNRGFLQCGFRPVAGRDAGITFAPDSKPGTIVEGLSKKSGSPHPEPFYFGVPVISHFPIIESNRKLPFLHPVPAVLRRGRISETE